MRRIDDDGTTADRGERAEPGDRPLRLLVFAPHTPLTRGRSGIHRVVMRLAAHLPACAHVDLVKWDAIEGQLRYCDHADLQAFFGQTPRPRGIGVHPMAHAVDYRFADTVERGDRVIVLMPEVFYLIEDGNEIHARVISQAIAEGWTTAAIFYDLIPLKGGYETRDAHARYVAELLRVDIALAISHYSAQALRKLYKETLGLDEGDLARSRQEVLAIPLADRDADFAAKADPPDALPRDTILLLGTVEPRKQQVRVIEAFKRLRLNARAGLELVVIGGLNPNSQADFHTLIDGDATIRWLGHASDAEIDEAFARARFSVFASNDEGFGLPIVESLSRGVPCLTAKFGAMREAAEGGGCVMVDVDSGAAIDNGLTRLALDGRLVAACRREIDERAWRTWADYAHDIGRALARYDAPRTQARAVAATMAGLVRRRLAERRSGDDAHGVIRFKASTAGLPAVVVDVIDGPGRAGPERTDGAIRIAVVGARVDPLDLTPRRFDDLLQADAWFCHERAAYDAIVSRAKDADRLLSGCCGWCDTPDALVSMITDRVATLLERRLRAGIAALRDSRYQSAWTRLACPRPDPTLTLVISTYNGGAFIERNIAHCLALMEPFGGRVRLVVADNASTDDTRERVEPFVRDHGVEYVAVPCNTGLLGNLHLVSTLVRARHVWVIGVDDIIVPGALGSILEVLDRDPACPFVMPNFAVYHRECLSPEDTCAQLLGERRPVGTRCDPDGMLDVRRAASQHDNLLTAFYIIVFRSDLMAAVFNNPFTAPFFGSLVDTVPTTKVIFEAFADYAAAWLREPAIVGNAHNTWRHHRVAWHGILMPITFELAREAGLDAGLLKRWSRQHVDLLREAEDLFPNPGIVETFPPEALAASIRVFGDDLLMARG